MICAGSCARQANQCKHRPAVTPARVHCTPHCDCAGWKKKERREKKKEKEKKLEDFFLGNKRRRCEKWTQRINKPQKWPKSGNFPPFRPAQKFEARLCLIVKDGGDVSLASSCTALNNSHFPLHETTRPDPTQVGRSRNKRLR